MEKSHLKRHTYLWLGNFPTWIFDCNFHSSWGVFLHSLIQIWTPNDFHEIEIENFNVKNTFFLQFDKWIFDISLIFNCSYLKRHFYGELFPVDLTIFDFMMFLPPRECHLKLSESFPANRKIGWRRQSHSRAPVTALHWQFSTLDNPLKTE